MELARNSRIEKEKAKVTNAKPNAYLEHVSPHCVGGAKIFHVTLEGGV